MAVLLSEDQFIDLYNYLADEERLGPSPNEGRVTCDNTLHCTVKWMMLHQVQDILANVEKIMDLGGHCDCEVLLNVPPDVWEERREEEITGPDSLGKREWKQFVADMLHDSGYSSEG